MEAYIWLNLQIVFDNLFLFIAPWIIIRTWLKYNICIGKVYVYCDNSGFYEILYVFIIRIPAFRYRKMIYLTFILPDLEIH